MLLIPPDQLLIAAARDKSFDFAMPWLYFGRMNSRLIRAVLTGGLIGGALDLMAAFVFLGLRGSDPARVLQSITSGLVGMKAYDGGMYTAALGVLLHFFIAITAALAYCLAKLRLSFPKSPIVSGLLYGVVVYSFMNFVVLPLSAFPHTIRYTVRGLLVIMFCIGLPISFAARRLFKKNQEFSMNVIRVFVFGLFSLLIVLNCEAAGSKATFAGGCYWCMEEAMEHVPGVTSVISGFSGGVEAVELQFDPSQITYDQLLDAYWRNIDPTDAGGQFCDRGDRYRSAIFFYTQEQKIAAERSREELANKWNRDVATAILPAGPFRPAPDSEQDYYKKKPYDYKQYKIRCGRERRLRAVWKEPKNQ